MRLSLCKHSFPVLPPHGSIFRPGDCTGCGITYDAVQADLRRQEEALILGTARGGPCPHCGHTRRLYRYQPPVQPWHSPDYTPPARWLCVDGWNAAADEDNALLRSALAEATPAT